ncbi:MAG: S26 family signal peptidase [Planctomycetota bacterium]
MTIVLILGCQSKHSVPGLIVGPSMAPSFVGTHFEVECHVCKFPFRVDSDQAGSIPNFVCPNCGELTSKSEAVQKSADRVEIVHSKTLSRFDVIAFTNPSDERVAIKRIIGLDNQAVELVHGELLIDGRLIQKDIVDQKKVRHLVHDSKFRHPELRWQKTVDQDGATWRTFYNKPCFRMTSNESKWMADRWTSVMFDYFGFNQNVGRKLNTVRDIAFEFRVDSSDEFRFQCLESEKLILDVELLPNVGRLNWYFNGNSNQFRIHPKKQGWRVIEVSNFDGQWWVVLDGDTVAKKSVVTDQASYLNRLEKPDSSHFTYRISDNQKSTERIKVYRDVYYFDSESSNGHSAFPASKGLIVLGDNLPLSSDSRTWTQNRIPRQNVLGIVRKSDSF